MKRKAVRFTDAGRTRSGTGSRLASPLPRSRRTFTGSERDSADAARHRGCPTRRPEPFAPSASLAEREEISRSLLGRVLMRLDRQTDRSVLLLSVSRDSPANGGRRHYPSGWRQTPRHFAVSAARSRQSSPAVASFVSCRRGESSSLRWSPQQIAKWLPGHYPDRRGDAGEPRDHLPCRSSSKVGERCAKSCPGRLRTGRAIRRSEGRVADPPRQGHTPTW